MPQGTAATGESFNTGRSGSAAVAQDESSVAARGLHQVDIMRDSSITLADGRSLAYTEIGAPGGPVIMYFHGAPSSRLDTAVEDAFAGLDVRVVSADRPGYGGSSPQPGRHREDWPYDVAALADRLGVKRFAVMGVSSGGPYAVACLALLPDRVAGAAIVGA